MWCVLFWLCVFLGCVLNRQNKNIYRNSYTESCFYRQNIKGCWIAAHSPYKRHALYWSKSVSVVCSAPCVRTRQTRWITLSWLWVTVLQRVAGQELLGHSLGGSMGELRPRHVFHRNVRLLRSHQLISFQFHQTFLDWAREKHVRLCLSIMFTDQGQYMRSTQSNISNNNTREIAGMLLLVNKVIWQMRMGGTQFIYTED